MPESIQLQELIDAVKTYTPWAIALLGFSFGTIKEIQNRKLRKEVIIDYLTSTHTRKFFEEILIEQLAHAARHPQHPVSIVILDIDNFKLFNDTYGHRTGDLALMAVGKILKTHTRKLDVVGRYGGEEFGIILPETNLQEAVEAATHILTTTREQLKQGNQFGIKFGKTFNVPRDITFSIGITSISGESSSDQAVNLADEQLYLAKNSGRNRIVANGITYLAK